MVVTVAGFAAATRPPPLQLSVFPALLPVRTMFVLVQVIGPVLLAVTTGRIALLVTITVAVLVQPFVGSVAVTVYVPAAVVVAGFEALINDPPFQTIILFILLPVKVELFTVQSRFPLLKAVTTGGLVLLNTATVPVAVQLFPGFVTTRVYIPAAETKLVAVAGPAVH